MNQTVKSLLAFAAVITLTGCVSRDAIVIDNSIHRNPAQSVDVYTEGRMPDRPYKVFATFSWLGPRQDELRATKWFISQAKGLGADGMIFEWPPRGDQKSMGLWGANGGGFGSSTAYVFKGDAFVYSTSTNGVAN